MNTLIVLATMSLGQLFVVNPQIPTVIYQQPQPVVVQYQYVVQQPQYVIVPRTIYVPVQVQTYQPVYYPYPIYRIYP
jgi:hypothetical protein